MSELHFFALFFASLVFWAIYVTVEGLRWLGYIDGEMGRKAIHISVGVFIASMPVFLNVTEIIVINSLFFLGLIVLAPFKVFSAYEAVNRWTIGQYLYPLSIILLAFMIDDPLIFSFAVLELALADGLAALIGKKHGRKKFHIPGGTKTWVGSITFFAITLTLVLLYATIESDFTPTLIGLILAGSIMMTFVEGIIAGGFDNLAIPILMAVVLQDLA